MTAWMAAMIALVPPFAVSLGVALRGGMAGRLASVQLATALALPMLLAASFAFGQPYLLDLALALGLLTLPGTLLLVAFMERWL